MSTTPAPRTDAGIPAYVSSLGIAGLADVHIHFLPEPMLAKVWQYFDRAEAHYGRAWPIHYRTSQDERLATLRRFGVRRIPALSYAHRPNMAQWLNAWSAELAAAVPDVLHCGTFFPEPGARDHVEQAIAGGVQLFKLHVQVGNFAPDDEQLLDAWELVQDSGIPTVMHAGSAPIPGEYTGAAGVRRLLRRFPGLRLVIAHLGMPEYDAFADLAQEYPGVHLDTTMIGTDFTEQFAPLPVGYRDRLSALRGKVILGSDFPNIPYAYAHQLEALTRLELGDDWMRDVLWHNGTALLRDSASIRGAQVPHS
ncbi:amidohydrolase family protein [Nakamurella sp. A5-74]|uniref:Amidohydrolase family protein n=1 Tax=Nakamurella sp. A5-74 TaxID=3158264 RepID=A0AAU8DPK4_9ACTN